MKRSNALSLYLLGALGQILIVCVVVFLLRSCGLIVDYTSPFGLAAIAIGGISTALWGAILTIKYRKTTLGTIVSNLFRIKQSYKDYLLVLLFLVLDFFPVIFGGEILIKAWYLPMVLFVKHIAFGGIEEIGWRYFFQPVLQERMNYVVATITTFVAWGIWHFLYFYIDGSISEVDAFSFLIGLLTNCFILSALYVKTGNLWLCVMTHSLINVFSQLLVGGNECVSYACKIIIITVAIALVGRRKV